MRNYRKYKSRYVNLVGGMQHHTEPGEYDHLPNRGLLDVFLKPLLEQLEILDRFIRRHPSENNCMIPGENCQEILVKFIIEIWPAIDKIFTDTDNIDNFNTDEGNHLIIEIWDGVPKLGEYFLNQNRLLLELTSPPESPGYLHCDYGKGTQHIREKLTTQINELISLIEGEYPI